MSEVLLPKPEPEKENIVALPLLLLVGGMGRVKILNWWNRKNN